MIGTLLFNILAVLFAWLESRWKFKHGLKLSVFTVFVFLALRYDFGNDYMSYLEIFEDINKHSIFDQSSFNIKGNELGWIFINRLFGPLGFFALVAFLAAFSCIVLYRFIKKYVPLNYYWFAVFIYAFQPYNMLVLSSAMRQAVAVSLFLIAIDFIVQKKIVKYIFTILIAMLFHTSAALLLPFILLGFTNWRLNLKHIILLLILFTIPLLFLNEIVVQINLFTSQYFDFYEGYIEKSEINIDFGLGFILNILIYLTVLNKARSEIDFGSNIFFKITIISMLLIPLTFGIQFVNRLNLYLVPLMAVVFPLSFNKFKNIIIKRLFIMIVALFTLYNFYVFFQSDVWIENFGVYKTILSSPTIY